MLLLDEPLGALDLKLREEMQVELKQIQREVGITFVYVTHDQDEALSMSDRIAVFNHGRIEQVGTPAEVYERPVSEFVAGFVGVSNMLERDGRRFTIRPEKSRSSTPAMPPRGSRRGRHRRRRELRRAGDALRGGARRGGRVLVTRPNLETSQEGPRPARAPGTSRMARDQTFAVGRQTTPPEEEKT